MSAKAAAVSILRAGRGWREDLINDGGGKPKPILANAITALQSGDWAGVLAFEEHSQTIVARKSGPWGDPKAVGDQEDRLATEWLQRQRILVNSATTHEAIQTVAMKNRFHRVRDWLDSLKWDGCPRIDQWLSLYLGSENSEFTQAVGARWLISAVARVYNPGCKVDCCVILEGPQGVGKSSALREIGGKYFTDEIADLGSKDAAMQLHGAWLVEIAELDSMSRSEVGKIKAFISRQTDRYRPAYGRHVIEVPRQCVFAGSTNRESYLKDETGGRRFWPVLCGKIDLDALRRDRDNLLAEAVHRFKEGAPWWLESPELRHLAEQQQAERYEGDPWDELIKPWLLGRSETSVSEVLQKCIDKPANNWNQSDMTRVARSLVSLGWEKRRARRSEGNVNRYFPCS